MALERGRVVVSRRRILVLVVVTALVFLGIGTSVGYWVVPDSKSPSAQCIVARSDLDTLTYLGGGNTSSSRQDKIDNVVEIYNKHCR